VSKQYQVMMACIKERAERDREDERIRSELSRAQFESFCRDAEERAFRQREIETIKANKPPGALTIGLGVLLGNLLSRMFGFR
jgi:hypothetical protein